MKNRILWIVVTTALVLVFIYSLFFSKPTYKVTFDSVGGTVVESQDVKRNNLAIKPENPVRDGYQFKEWQVNGDTYDFNTKITGNITITAVWEEQVKYKATFNSNGGSKAAVQEISEGGKVKKPTKPTKKGYKFVEWQVSGKKYNFDTKVTKDLTLKAKWKKN